MHPPPLGRRSTLNSSKNNALWTILLLIEGQKGKGSYTLKSTLKRSSRSNLAPVLLPSKSVVGWGDVSSAGSDVDPGSDVDAGFVLSFKAEPSITSFKMPFIAFNSLLSWLQYFCVYHWGKILVMIDTFYGTDLNHFEDFLLFPALSMSWKHWQWPPGFPNVLHPHHLNNKNWTTLFNSWRWRPNIFCVYDKALFYIMGVICTAQR